MLFFEFISSFFSGDTTALILMEIEVQIPHSASINIWEGGVGILASFVISTDWCGQFDLIVTEWW